MQLGVTLQVDCVNETHATQLEPDTWQLFTEVQLPGTAYLHDIHTDPSSPQSVESKQLASYAQISLMQSVWMIQFPVHAGSETTF